jgi:hypothetical protein
MYLPRMIDAATAGTMRMKKGLAVGKWIWVTEPDRFGAHIIEYVSEADSGPIENQVRTGGFRRESAHDPTGPADRYGCSHEEAIIASAGESRRSSDEFRSAIHMSFTWAP